MAGITSIAVLELHHSTPVIVVGRDDGMVQCYAKPDTGDAAVFDTGNNRILEPFLTSERNVGESVTNVAAGTSPILVVSTFSGKVIGIPYQPRENDSMGAGGLEMNLAAEMGRVFDQPLTRVSTVSSNAVADSFGRDGMPMAATQRLTHNSNVLGKMIESAKAEIERLEDRKAAQSAVVEVQGGMVGLSSYDFTIKDKFALNPLDASYTLTLETTCPIETVTLRSDFPVEIADAQSSGTTPAEKPAGILHFTPCDDTQKSETGTHVLGTYRCTGTRNTRADFITVRPGHATFKSNSPTSLTILKHALSREAGRRRRVVDTTLYIATETAEQVLKPLHDRLVRCGALGKEVAMIEVLKVIAGAMGCFLTREQVYTNNFAFQELRSQENGDISCLGPKYADILRRTDNIEAEYRSLSSKMDRTLRLISEVYVAIHEFRGNEVREKVPGLLKRLKDVAEKGTGFPITALFKLLL
ncbi:Bardet-Biedl syndrome 7 protein [Borealophlyctis nickersoniae]|nr:Bardet-Biedl syndrome 7 protein [Borealophlyctis nickersoniae]